MALDEYEQKFLDRRLEAAGSDAPFEKALVERALELYSEAEDVDVDSVQTLTDPLVMLRLVNYHERSVYYEELLQIFDASIQNEHDDPFDWVTAVYTFTPLIAQELEGVVKWGVGVLGYLAAVADEREIGAWPAHRENNKYLSDALEVVKANLDADDPVYKLVNWFEPDGSATKSVFIRNAIAHNDYVVTTKGADRTSPEVADLEVVRDAEPEQGIVVFLSESENLELPIPHVLVVFWEVQRRVKLLHLVLHLVFRRLTGQPERFPPEPKSGSGKFADDTML